MIFYYFKMSEERFHTYHSYLYKACDKKCSVNYFGFNTPNVNVDTKHNDSFNTHHDWGIFQAITLHANLTDLSS